MNEPINRCFTDENNYITVISNNSDAAIVLVDLGQKSDGNSDSLKSSQILVPSLSLLLQTVSFPKVKVDQVLKLLLNLFSVTLTVLYHTKRATGKSSGNANLLRPVYFRSKDEI